MTYRTNTCGELTEKELKKEVELSGWVATRRDHGGIIFIDLRDRYGITQVVLDPKKIPEANNLRREWCIKISGKVRARPKGMENPKMKTGKIEVESNKLEILNESETPPFEIDDRVETSEEVRLKYRYLDLRKKHLQENIIFRSEVIKFLRDWMHNKNFIEIETPILTVSSPEGARDFLVPSRLHPGKFYALPQAPQQYKQLLMVAGFERYYQIARALRDEDLRGDRQLEHTQIDMEMSYATPRDVWDVVEGMYTKITETCGKKILHKPFPVFTHGEAMKKFGADKFDMRE